MAALFDPDARTALHVAAFGGDVAQLGKLIGAGESLDPHDREGNTPLHLAVQEYRVEAARALVNAGASVRLRDVHGNTALWRATFDSRGRGELVKLLLDHGADPDCANDSGVTPRILAERIANYDVQQFYAGR